ncbi:hypothetical protein A2686_02960 [Candidatus Woesebacteria bacterium RIFCSPHIGHO2_01_FULL_38_10]|uniref:Uncharacterized protein n=1 Tax=Candidatus Woesebacteria bacterium RIFCSPLOWO2_01_FULL_39_10b TaxID=1802517 RepID=A0A1F8BAY5_9BACT|nr:MAG: hypothetical protein A2686_02960 [Candidatus Woesebacteria bacterium RIFCSPHIGHO2_01_FULL_38_10]OGM60518.1 MAG: hypothetical protein A2892_00650 [Candidatus Woesebacteria bacterium RIFCSPLOWO2_01_FULL_39_10b]
MSEAPGQRPAWQEREKKRIKGQPVTLTRSTLGPSSTPKAQPGVPPNVARIRQHQQQSGETGS